jgi:hypothetical protein
MSGRVGGGRRVVWWLAFAGEKMRIDFHDMHIPHIVEPSADAMRWAQVYSLMASLIAVGIWMADAGGWPAGLAIAGMAVAGAIEVVNPQQSKSMYRRKKLLKLRRLG